MLAVARRYMSLVDVANNDQADALVLAALGARQLSQPIDDLPQTHPRAMMKVSWPPTSHDIAPTVGGAA